MMPKKTFLSRTTWEPLRRFLAWWMRELANWVPARLRSWWEETGNIVLVTMEDDKVTFARPAAGQFQQIYQVDLASSSATALKPITAMQQLRGKTDSNARFLLCLSSTQVLRRSIVLPLAVEENRSKSSPRSAWQSRGPLSPKTYFRSAAATGTCCPMLPGKAASREPAYGGVSASRRLRSCSWSPF